MTHSRSLRTSELPDPRDDPNLIRTMHSFRRALQLMSVPELMALASQQAAALELEQRTLMTNLLSSRLSDSLQSLDTLQPSSRRTAARPSPAARGAAASQTSPAPPPRPGAVDLLAASKRLAPRVAAKLVLAEARREADRAR